MAGELAALAYEKNRLIKAGRSDLADRVRHTSVVLGDGAGYDIDSFDESGNSLFIEVKTTRQGKFADFQISPNGVVFLQDIQAILPCTVFMNSIQRPKPVISTLSKAI
jgi:hypothetical protein